MTADHVLAILPTHDERRTTPVRSRRPKPLHEALEIDEAAGVAAGADLTFAMERRDLEADDAAFHRDHLRRGANGGADRGGGEMADVDLGAERDPAWLEMRVDGVARRHLHLQ